MYKGRRVCVVVPAFNEVASVSGVVATTPPVVDDIVVVDDGSMDGTADAALSVRDPRLHVIRHPRNSGVGAAIVSGHRKALQLGADISVVMAGDGQMDPEYLPRLLDAIIDEKYDFAKGNRFLTRATLRGMPRHRVAGNMLLTFFTKFASGYWHVFDPQNGFTAVTAEVLRTLPLDELRKDYLFENDVLCSLYLHGFRVKDVPIPAKYTTGRSGIRVRRFAPSAIGFLLRKFWRRIFVRYVMWDFHPVALFYALGSLLLLGGIIFGAWVVLQALGPSVPTAGTVLLAVVPFLTGLQMVLTAITIDVWLTPR